MKSTLFLLLLLLLTVSCKAQQKQPLLKERRDSTKTGVKKHAVIQKTNNKVTPYGYGNIILCSLQDKAGNLWFGTSWHGVFRYDGTSFTNFTAQDGLGNNTVYAMLEDSAGKLWFGTEAGCCCFDGKTFSIVPLPANDSSNAALSFTGIRQSSRVTVLSLLEDNKGNIWFGTLDHGLYRYDRYSFTHFLGRSAIQDMLTDNKGYLWFGSWRYDGRSFIDFSAREGAPIRMVFCIAKDKGGDLWFGIRGNGVYRYDGQLFNYYAKKDGLFDGRVACMLEERNGRMWFGRDVESAGTLKGDICYYDGKSFHNFSAVHKQVYNVRTMLEDRAGNIWFGTRGMGLWRYDGKIFTDFSAHVFLQ